MAPTSIRSSNLNLTQLASLAANAVVPSAGKTFTLHNLAFNHVLDNAGSQTFDGNQVLAWTLNSPSTENQQVNFTYLRKLLSYLQEILSGHILIIHQPLVIQFLLYKFYQQKRALQSNRVVVATYAPTPKFVFNFSCYEVLRINSL